MQLSQIFGGRGITKTGMFEQKMIKLALIK
jgi:hypothetical protein